MLAQLIVSAQVTMTPHSIAVTELPLDRARDGFLGICDYLFRCRNLRVCCCAASYALKRTEDLEVMFWVVTSPLSVPRPLALVGQYSGPLR